MAAATIRGAIQSLVSSCPAVRSKRPVSIRLLTRRLLRKGVSCLTIASCLLFLLRSLPPGSARRHQRIAAAGAPRLLSPMRPSLTHTPAAAAAARRLRLSFTHSRSRPRRSSTARGAAAAIVAAASSPTHRRSRRSPSRRRRSTLSIRDRTIPVPASWCRITPGRRRRHTSCPAVIPTATDITATATPIARSMGTATATVSVTAMGLASATASVMATGCAATRPLRLWRAPGLRRRSSRRLPRQYVRPPGDAPRLSLSRGALRKEMLQRPAWCGPLLFHAVARLAM